MFDNKSHYARNKKRKDAIVYASVAEEIVLKQEDFASEEEFEYWKEWSDSDYQLTEKQTRGYYDHLTYVDEYTEFGVYQEMMDTELSSKEHTEVVWKEMRSILSPTQFRRIWLHDFKGLTVEQIAEVEGITHQGVSKSIRMARKKIFIFFRDRVAK